jgi:deazaflavin-dependent oxidoreductase (nitroreductase family)
MRKLFRLGVFAGLVIWAADWWRQHPRFGAEWVNRVADPWLVRQGMVDASEGEIGLIEHIGRKTGIVRVTPVHPVPTESGFRIVVPLGRASEWARNVIAAGRCRLQVGDVIHELDEPTLVAPEAVEGIAPVARRVMDWLGFRYLVLHRFGKTAGKLVADEVAVAGAGSPAATPVVAEAPAAPVPVEAAATKIAGKLRRRGRVERIAVPA